MLRTYMGTLAGISSHILPGYQSQKKLSLGVWLVSWMGFDRERMILD